MWVMLGLIGAAALIAFWMWIGKVRWEYLMQLAETARRYAPATDPWEEPKVIRTLGGIHDVEKDTWT